MNKRDKWLDTTPHLLSQAAGIIRRYAYADSTDDLSKLDRQAIEWLDAVHRWQTQDSPMIYRRGDGDTPKERDAAARRRLADEIEQHGTQPTPTPAVPGRVNGKCVWCREPMPVPSRGQGGGRTKRFCSPACKQAHHRWNKDPERYPDAQAWTLERRGLYATRDR